MTDDDSRLIAIHEAIGERALPPVHEWRPTVTQALDIRIASDGQWYHEGVPIRRERMVRLFSTVLRVDDDEETGEPATYLVTPQLRLRIVVDDAPFTAVALERHGAPEATTLVFTTNVGERVVADAEHPIVVEYAHPDADPRPYVVVRDRLRALISRAVFIELAGHAGEGADGALGVVSRGTFMRLGPVPGEASGAGARSDDGS